MKQEKEIQNLEAQVKAMQKPTIRERATAILEEARNNVLALKEKVNEVKDNIRDGAAFLAKTFQTSGKTAFCKAFAQFSHGLKAPFKLMISMNQKSFERTEKSVQRLTELQKETQSIGTSFKNIGRILIGRKAKNPEEDRHLPSVFGAMIAVSQSRNQIATQFASVCKNCMNQLDSLEKSFTEKSKETKKDLNSLISGATARRDNQEKTQTQEKDKER